MEDEDSASEDERVHRSLPSIDGPYANATIFGHSTSSKLDKDFGAKLKGKVSLSALPKTVTQGNDYYYKRMGATTNAQSQRSLPKGNVYTSLEAKKTGAFRPDKRGSMILQSVTQGMGNMKWQQGGEGAIT